MLRGEVLEDVQPDFDRQPQLLGRRLFVRRPAQRPLVLQPGVPCNLIIGLKAAKQQVRTDGEEGKREYQANEEWRQWNGETTPPQTTGLPRSTARHHTKRFNAIFHTGKHH